MNIPLFFDCPIYSREIIDAFSDLTKTLVFFTDAVHVRLFKLCIIITLLGVFQFIPGVSESYIAIVFLYSCSLLCKCMVLTLKRSGTVIFT